MPQMKRLLIITYYWPPSGGSGVQRWLKFSKYLPKHGWQPVIYTPSNPDFPIRDESLKKDIPPEAEILKKKIREPYQIYKALTGGASNANFGLSTAPSKRSFLGRISLWVRGNIFVPDPRVFWRRPSVQFLKSYLKKNPVDAVVTTGPPHSLHLIGLDLKKTFPKLPWIADMRDPWSNFDIHNAFLSENARKKNAALERQVLDLADQVIMVSPSLHEEFQKLDENKISLISNGFDEADFQFKNKPITADDGFFRVYHTGLLNYIRNPENLWQSIEELCKENSAFKKRFRLELIGNVDPAVQRAINAHPNLKNKVNIRGWLAHETLLEENRRADLFLLIVNNSRNARAQLTGKLFEYLAMGQPIFAICPADADVARVLRQTGAGSSVAFEEQAKMKAQLLSYFEKWLKNELPHSNYERVRSYSRKHLTGKLVNLLDDLLFSSPPIA